MILVVSNGYGEDLIASHLICALRDQQKDVPIRAFPLVGVGTAYEKIGVPLLDKTKVLPSGGFVRSVFSFIKDLFSGLISVHFKHLKLIKAHADTITMTIVVGDVFALCLSRFWNKHPTFFLPTAKSDHFMPHMTLEYFLIKRFATKTYLRDRLTAASFQKRNIVNAYLGNPMLDGLTVQNQSFGLDLTRFVLGILPGSRQEAYLNLLHILTIVLHFSKHIPDAQFVLAKADILDLDVMSESLTQCGWQYDAVCIPWACLKHIDTNTCIVVTDQFPDVVHVSNALIGLAGTANEQAVYMGRHVFCFQGDGPQSQYKRFQEQRRLLGPMLHLLSDRSPTAVAAAIAAQFTAGRLTKTPFQAGPPAAPVIVTDILEAFNQV